MQLILTIDKSYFVNGKQSETDYFDGEEGEDKKNS